MAAKRPDFEAVVRARGLEPLRSKAPPGPKPGASTNSATPARVLRVDLSSPARVRSGSRNANETRWTHRLDRRRPCDRCSDSRRSRDRDAERRKLRRHSLASQDVQRHRPKVGAPDAGGDDDRRHRQEGFPAPGAQASPHPVPTPGLGGGRAGDAVPTREWRPASGALRRRLLSERSHTATELPLRKDTSPTAARSGVEAVRRRVRANQLLHGSPLARLPTSAGSASGVRSGRSRGRRETARSYIL